MRGDALTDAEKIVLDENDLVMYTIYDHPKDHPAHFVVRMWIVRDGRQYASTEARLAGTLEEARAFVPADKVMTPRLPQDDPVIVETWI